MLVRQSKVQALKMEWDCANGVHKVQRVAFGVDAPFNMLCDIEAVQ